LDPPPPTPRSATGLASQTGGSPYYREGHQKQYIANLNWSKGKHDVRFGTEIDQQYTDNVQTASQGSFTFGSGPTQLSGGPSGNQFNSYATFLLGLVTSAADAVYFNDPPSIPAVWTWYNAYVRDRWNITPKLTASLGVRWDYYGFPNMRYRGAAAYDLASNQAEICGMGSVARMVKIFMRRGCSTGVSRQGVLDSGCHVADRAQAELGRGRAERCSCLDGCVLRDNALGTGGALSLTSVPRTGSGGTSTPL